MGGRRRETHSARVRFLSLVRAAFIAPLASSFFLPPIDPLSRQSLILCQARPVFSLSLFLFFFYRRRVMEFHTQRSMCVCMYSSRIALWFRFSVLCVLWRLYGFTPFFFLFRSFDVSDEIRSFVEGVHTMMWYWFHRTAIDLFFLNFLWYSLV